MCIFPCVVCYCPPFTVGVYSSIPDQLKVNTAGTVTGSGAGLEEGYYASPKSTFEQVYNII